VEAGFCPPPKFAIRSAIILGSPLSCPQYLARARIAFPTLSSYSANSRGGAEEFARFPYSYGFPRAPERTPEFQSRGLLRQGLCESAHGPLRGRVLRVSGSLDPSPTEDTWKATPLRCFLITGSAARVVFTTPQKHVSTIPLKSPALICPNGANCAYPALLTRTSNRPKA
jgi:hypothetical protein